jgi:hypothetical protein
VGTGFASNQARADCVNLSAKSTRKKEEQIIMTAIVSQWTPDLTADTIIQAARGDSAQLLAWKLRRIEAQMAVLKKGWRNCALSDCRRERACVGEALPCLAITPDPAVRWSLQELADWHTLLQARRDCRARLHKARPDVIKA